MLIAVIQVGEGIIIRKAKGILATAVIGGPLLQMVMEMQGPAPQTTEGENHQSQKQGQAFHL